MNAITKYLIILFIFTFSLICCDNGENNNNLVTEKSIPVHVVPVIKLDISFPVHTAGMVSLKETVKLSFKTGGIIAVIFVDEGQTVYPGQILAQLDLSEIQAQVEIVRSDYEKRKRDLERVQNLYADKVATLEQLQDAETAFKVAESNLKVAEFNLAHSLIYAPSEGKILKRFVEQGELVNAGMPVFIFASTEKNWIIRLGVIDRDMTRLTLGDPAEVVFDVYPGKPFNGFITEIAQAADSLSGTFEVELSLEEQDGNNLVSGFIGKVDIYPTKKETLYFVPINAIIEGNKDKSYVFTVDKQTKRAQKVSVHVRKILDEYVAISAGLEHVELVVTKGAGYLEQDSLLDIVSMDKNNFSPPTAENDLSFR